MQNVQSHTNLALKLNQIKLQERNNQLFTKPVPILCGLWSYIFKKLQLTTQGVELLNTKFNIKPFTLQSNQYLYLNYWKELACNIN